MRSSVKGTKKVSESKLIDKGSCGERIGSIYWIRG